MNAKRFLSILSVLVFFAPASSMGQFRGVESQSERRSVSPDSVHALERGWDSLDALVENTRKNLPAILNRIPSSQLPTFGYSSREELKAARADTLVKEAHLSEDGNYVVFVDKYYLPVTNASNQVTLFIHLVKSNHKWNIFSTGANALAERYQEIVSDPSVKRKIVKSERLYLMAGLGPEMFSLGIESNVYDKKEKRKVSRFDFFFYEYQGDSNKKKIRSVTIEQLPQVLRDRRSRR